MTFIKKRQVYTSIQQIYFATYPEPWWKGTKNKFMLLLEQKLKKVFETNILMFSHKHGQVTA